ncbi:MAG TPA: hypothetical protein VF585_03155 [Chthoniobacterales bacterium]|jgi:hypothetical protein
MMPLLLSPLRPSRLHASLVAVVIVLLTECGLPALVAQTINTQSSFSDTIELADPKSAIAEAVSDTEDLLKQNLLLQEQVRSISEALVQAKTEADTAVTENRELKTRIEALGLNAIGNDRSKLEQRLVKAVNDLSVAQSALSQNKLVLASLSEAILSLLKTSKDVNPEARLVVEAELRNANQSFSGDVELAQKAEPIGASLTNARVISMKPELGLLVGNIGSIDAVKIGMPFRVYDGQTAIALVRVVDVREKLFGALIQETLSDKTPVKVGQRLKVAAN